MRKLFLSAFILLGLAMSLNAQVLFTENFDYSVGALLTANGYLGHSGAGTNAQTVITGNLTYAGYAASGIGNSMKLVNTGEDCSKRFIATDSVVSGSIYFSCLVKVDSARTGDYFLHVANPGLQGIAYSARVQVKKANNGNIAFGIGKISNTVNSPKYTDSIYTFGTTYLIVARYKFVDGANNDEVSLWVNPTLSATEPTPLVTVTDATLADVTSLATIAIRQGSTAAASNLTVDGILVSKTWIGGGSTPVELASFVGSFVNGSVQLNWATASELNNREFVIEKMLNGLWQQVGSINGKGTTAERSVYSFVDDNIAEGSIQYRLKQVDFDGTANYSNAIEVVVGKVGSFSLDQNYPNPFNPSTSISYSVAKAGQVTLKVYDQLGSEVRELVNEVKAPGKYTVRFDASSLTTGVYFYKLNANGTTLVKKALFVK